MCACAEYLCLRDASLRPSELRCALALDGFTKLGLSGNSTLGDEGVTVLADALGDDAALAARCVGLYLSRCSVGSAGASALASALRRLREGCLLQVRELGLNDNALDDEAALALAPLLRAPPLASLCSSLCVLGLSANQLGDHAAVALAEAIRSGGARSAVRKIFLNSNQVCCAGAEAFGALLRSEAACSLRRVGLAHNRIEERGAAALAAGARAAATTLERICLFGNPFLSAAADAAERPAAARHQLSQMPNVHLNGLAVVRMGDGSDHYWWHAPPAPAVREEDEGW